MKREIKFRGKRLDNKEWVYGGISIFRGEAVILDYDAVDNSAWDVDPATVGQSTGLKDQHGYEVYEHDLLKYNLGISKCDDDDAVVAKVEWSNEDARYMLVNDNDYIREPFDADCCENAIVIGNIHDNKGSLQ